MVTTNYGTGFSKNTLTDMTFSFSFHYYDMTY